jgi:photosystem II stability/assembly factor-like uncharacterized protein
MRWIAAAIFFVALPIAHAQSSPFQIEQSTTTASLRGIHAVGGGVAWASGTNGTVLRKEDGGVVWQGCDIPPGAEKLDFRGVWAWDAMTAIVMSSGPGDQSRLYKTTDGCVSWKLLLSNADKGGFWDAIAFSDKDSGYLFGDPVDGRFELEITADGGKFWVKVPDAPEALAGSGAFAASNSSLVLVPAGDGINSPPRPLFGTGGSAQAGAASQARVYQAVSRMFWRYSAVPIAGANSASGVFSLAFQMETSAWRSAAIIKSRMTRPARRRGQTTEACIGPPLPNLPTATAPPLHGMQPIKPGSLPVPMAATTRATMAKPGSLWTLQETGATGMPSACPGSSGPADVSGN